MRKVKAEFQVDLTPTVFTVLCLALLTACQPVVPVSVESATTVTASIEGRVWHDLCAVDGEGGAPLNPSSGCSQANPVQANGQMEADEPGIAGLTVTIGPGDCTSGDAIINRARTNEDGRFRFDGLVAGAYCVGIEALADENLPILVPGGWTHPADDGRAAVELSAASVATVNFGWDYQFLPLPEGANLVADPFTVARAIIERVDESAAAPQGWQVAPCEGSAPVLCVQTDSGQAGYVELNLFDLRVTPELRATLATHGLDMDALDTASASYQRGAVPALRAFGNEHLASVEADRRATFGERVQFVAAESQPVDFGPLPGLQYGFALLAADGSVAERTINVAAFDEDYLYIVGAFYAPNHESAFSHDDMLRTFEPFLQQIVAALQLDDLRLPTAAFVRDDVLYVQPDAPRGTAVAVEDCADQTCRILYPKWSPDGSHLLYYRESLDEPQQAQIRIATLDGETYTVTDEAAWIRPADWSPDGERIVYLRATERFADSATMGQVRSLEVWTADVVESGAVQNEQLRGEIGFGEGCGGGGRSNSANVYEEEGGFAYGYLAGIVEWTAGDILLFSNNCGSRGVGRFDVNTGLELEPYADPLASLTLDSSGTRWAAIDSENRIVLGTPDALDYTALENVTREEGATLELLFFGSVSGRLYYTTLKRVGDFVDLVDEMSQLGEDVSASPYFDFTQPAMYAFDAALTHPTLLWQGDGYAYARLAEMTDGSLLFARVESNHQLFEALQAGTATAENVDDLLPGANMLRLSPAAKEPVLWLDDVSQVSLVRGQ